MNDTDIDHKYNLFYGLQGDKLRHISEVPNGLKCKCSCPACEKKLIARNGGRKRIHHFAHYENSECRYGVQTSIHLAAKQILEKSKHIRIPPVSVFINTELEEGVKYDFDKFDDFDELDEIKYRKFISHGEYHNISSEQDIEIDNVILEKKLHKYIPDVIIISRGKKLIIEIAVTHFVGRQKLEKIITSKISAIEIDLSKLDNDFNLKDLEELIVDNLENKKWLYNQFAIEKKPDKQIKIRKKIEEKNRKKWQEYERKRIEKERYEHWCKQYYKPVFYRKISDDYTIPQIENCPLKKRKYQEQYYASVNSDCSKCEHGRGIRDEKKFLVCLYDYHVDKQKKH